METKKRPIFKIAQDISKDWGTKVNFGAKPYLVAMFDVTNIDDYYKYELAGDVVRRFLANAGTWRGETARKIKNELKTLLK